MKYLILIFLTIFPFGKNLLSFPGDHNSLTCDKTFLGLTVQWYENETQLQNKTPVPKLLIKDDLEKIYRTQPTPGTIQFENRKNIVEAIKADLAKPHAQSVVKQNIRKKIATSHEGRDLHMTKLGDSLSEFIGVSGLVSIILNSKDKEII